MTSRRFPRSPDIHKRPFDDGPNPFADDSPESQAPHTPTANDRDNVFSAPSAVDSRPGPPPDFECTLPNRSRKVLIVGCIGFGLAVLCVAFAGLIVFISDWVEGMIYCLPIGLICLVFAIPAITLGLSDLRAIRAGAMDPSGVRGTRIGFWLGIAAGVMGLLPTVAGIASIVIAVMS